MVETLKKNPAWKGRNGPVVLVIMDGVGYGKYTEGDAVAAARMDALLAIKAKSPHVKLKAHGKAVGLPSDEDMGNSEVGHNAMGCGRVFNQGAALVSKSIESGPGRKSWGALRTVGPCTSSASFRTAMSTAIWITSRP